MSNEYKEDYDKAALRTFSNQVENELERGTLTHIPKPNLNMDGLSPTHKRWCNKVINRVNKMLFINGKNMQYDEY